METKSVAKFQSTGEEIFLSKKAYGSWLRVTGFHHPETGCRERFTPASVSAGIEIGLVFLLTFISVLGSFPVLSKIEVVTGRIKPCGRIPFLSNARVHLAFSRACCGRCHLLLVFAELRGHKLRGQEAARSDANGFHRYRSTRAETGSRPGVRATGTSRR